MNRESIFSRGAWLCVPVLLGLVLASDLGWVAFDFVNWDDPMHVLENPLITQPGSVPLADHLLTPSFGYPIPLTVLTYRLNHLLGGFAPGGYHLVNVLLHLFAVALVYHIGRRLGLAMWISAGTALLYGLHPVTVEPVVWVTGRKDVLAACLALGTFSLFLAFRRSRHTWYLWAAGLCYVGSLLSKPSAIGLGLVIIAATWFDRGPRRQGMVFGGVLVGVGIAVSIIVARLVVGVGAISNSVTLGDRLENFSQAGYLYLQTILFPLDLRVKYILEVEGTAAPFPIAELCILLLVCAGLLLIAFHRRLRNTAAGLGALWFLLAMAPVSGLIPSPRFASDSYLYLGLPGLCWVLGDAMGMVIAKKPRSKWGLVVLSIVALLALVPLRASTAEKWQDGVHLWEATFVIYPDSPQVCRKLGNAHRFGSPLASSPVESSLRAIAVYEMCMETLGQREMFTANLGVVHYDLGNLEASRAYFLEALQTNPSDGRVRGFLERIEARLSE